MTDHISLWHWRRAVADFYAVVRAEADPRAARRYWQDERRALFTGHPQSPIPADERARYPGPHLFPYDLAFRFVVPLETITGGSPERMDAGADGGVTLIPFARTAGLATALGGELTLYWIEAYGGGVFLPFRDATNGRETYGGGRYLLDTVKGADLGSDAEGRAILDFNFAYFPSCAYSDRYICPLSPAANRLAMPVRAGERLAGDVAE